MATRNDITTISFKYGEITAVGLVLYFLIMKLLGLVQILELRAINFFILGAGILLAIRHYRHIQNGPVDYLEGFGLGMATCFISCVSFSIFMFIYLRFLDPAFMDYIKATAPLGQNLNPFTASFWLLIEGDASGAIVTLLGLQYYRKPKLSVKNDREYYLRHQH